MIPKFKQQQNKEVEQDDRITALENEKKIYSAVPVAREITANTETQVARLVLAAGFYIINSYFRFYITDGFATMILKINEDPTQYKRQYINNLSGSDVGMTLLFKAEAQFTVDLCISSSANTKTYQDGRYFRLQAIKL